MRAMTAEEVRELLEWMESMLKTIPVHEKPIEFKFQAIDHGRRSGLLMCKSQIDAILERGSE